MKCINSNVNKQFISLQFLLGKENMSGKSIQLPFGVVREKSKEKLIKLNLPLNYRKDVLFDHIPYLGHPKNPAIKDVARDGVVDNIALQKYLLVTDWSFKRQFGNGHY